MVWVGHGRHSLFSSLFSRFGLFFNLVFISCFTLKVSLVMVWVEHDIPSLFYPFCSLGFVLCFQLPCLLSNLFHVLL